MFIHIKQTSRIHCNCIVMTIIRYRVTARLWRHINVMSIQRAAYHQYFIGNDRAVVFKTPMPIGIIDIDDSTFTRFCLVWLLTCSNSLHLAAK